MILRIWLLLCFSLLISPQEIIFGEDENTNLRGSTLCSGDGDLCTALAQCQTDFGTGLEIALEPCTLSDGVFGICCPKVSMDDLAPSVIGDIFQLTERGKVNRPLLPDIGAAELDLAIRTVPERVKKIRDEEDFLLTKINTVLGGDLGTFSVISLRQTSSFAHFSLFGGLRETLSISSEALQVAQASKQLQESLRLTPQQAGIGLSRFSLTETQLGSTCLMQPRCNFRSKYRTIDGSCNNLRIPLLGRSQTTFNRLLDAQYGDGIWSERRSKDGTKLPSARFVSASIASDAEVPRPELSVAIAHWGQFIDHDITLTPTFTLRNGSGIECCSSNGRMLPPSFLHPQCLPIEIPNNDRFYSRFRRTCMNFVRSMIGQRMDCNFGYTEQINEITHWMDGSMVYGSTPEQARSVRAFQGGRLRTSFQRSGRKSTLPIESQRTENCGADVCYIAGDKRVNEQTMLAAFHTIFVREHNRIATSLQQLNPLWSDEQLYQESRRIVAAEIQHITYNEWLPNIVGQKFMKAYSLWPRRNGYFLQYDEKIDARINNEFSTAAFRFGHSLLPSLIQVVDGFGRRDQSSELSMFFDDGGKLTSPSYLDSIIRGMLTSPSQNFDNAFTPEITTKLFRGNLPFGMDLIALNTQRGRDHGLPGYIQYRSVCGLPSVRTFEDLIGTIPAATAQALSRIYRHVDDIDLFIGGISEIAAPGSLLGPTFTCIVADQFARLRAGDRFFYDIGNQLHSFSQGNVH
ncbi:hypothetical protein QYM36_016995 [Artemia franciscana]|uniref:Chorion peroxidase n=1 Tax=Artemia franciscana TaxID=6661 RepID=A0AA88KVB5_ARTSF|nr:hypothetical protein QYM36_016995 [Artemia franciscana]